MRQPRHRLPARPTSNGANGAPCRQNTYRRRRTDSASLAPLHALPTPIARSIAHSQGTVGLEFMRQIRALGAGDLDALIVPVGGGGLIGGIATAAKALHPTIKAPSSCATTAPALTSSPSSRSSGPSPRARRTPSARNGTACWGGTRKRTRA